MRLISFVWLAAVAFPRSAAAQGTEPLHKADLVRLLSSPVISRGEVADVVRRNCLAFRPTERDWADLRVLGASAEVVASIAGCVARRTAPEPAPAGVAPLEVVPREPRVAAQAGALVRVVVIAARGGTPQAGVRLVLRGSAAVGAGLRADVTAVTDGAGLAVFELPAGRQAVRRRFEIGLASGGALPGRPTVELLVRGGAPRAGQVDPRRLEFGPGLQPAIPVSVVVRDSLANPVAGEVVVLRAGSPDMGFRPDSAVTDSLGRATFVVAGAALRRPGTLRVSARNVALGSVDVGISTAISPTATGFRPGPTRGLAGTGLAEPLVFEVRTDGGGPAEGRLVRFRAVNARLGSDSAVTDSLGRARVDVALGERAGSAVVFATVDSLEDLVTLQIEPGPIAELHLEYNGARVDSGRVVVPINTPFVMRLRGRDAFGNAASVAVLAQRLRETRAQFAVRQRYLQLLAVEQEDSAVVLRFKPVMVGYLDLTIGSGLTTKVRVEVVRRG